MSSNWSNLQPQFFLKKKWVTVTIWHDPLALQKVLISRTINSPIPARAHLVGLPYTPGFPQSLLLCLRPSHSPAQLGLSKVWAWPRSPSWARLGSSHNLLEGNHGPFPRFDRVLPSSVLRMSSSWFTLRLENNLHFCQLVFKENIVLVFHHTGFSFKNIYCPTLLTFEGLGKY